MRTAVARKVPVARTILDTVARTARTARTVRVVSCRSYSDDYNNWRVGLCLICPNSCVKRRRNWAKVSIQSGQLNVRMNE